MYDKLFCGVRGTGTIILNEGRIKVINSDGAFDADLGEWFFNITASNGSYTIHNSWKITTNNGNLPVFVLTGGDTPNGCPYQYAHGNILPWINAWSNQAITQYIETELVSSTGDTDRIINGALYASRFIYFEGLLSDTEDFNITIDTNIPVLAGEYYLIEETSSAYYWGWNEDDLTSLYVVANEIINGDYTNIGYAINGDAEEVEEINEDVIYYCYNTLKTNGTATATHSYQFKIDKNAKIYLTASLPHDNTAGTNVTLTITKTNYQWRTYPNGTWTQGNAPTTAFNYWYNSANSWTNLTTGDILSASMARNIKMFTSTADADNYAETGDDSNAIGGGEFGTKESTTGSSLDSSDIPNIVPALSGVGSYIYVLSDTDLKSVMTNCLYNTDQTVIDSIKEGLWLWGNNPIDFLVDLYYVPFNISYFYNVDSALMKFGSYTFSGDTYGIVDETSGNRVTLFNTFIDYIYGDWRDFSYVKYDLYLPYIGFVNLDPNLYVGKNVKCEMMFDVTTHNLRYYLYCNNVIADRFDGSVGLNLPLMATDQVNKAKQDIAHTKGAINNLLGIGTNVAMGNIGGAISGIMDYAQNVATVAGQKPTEEVVGGYSSSMNIYDIRYAYLKITQTNHIAPYNLNSIYNYPSYYIGYLSNLNGYCELEDVQLISNATEQEQEEIKGLLRGGVIF